MTGSLGVATVRPYWQNPMLTAVTDMIALCANAHIGLGTLATTGRRR